MKPRRRPSPLLLLLIPVLLPTATARSVKALSSDSSLVKRETTHAGAQIEAAVVAAKANPVGTKDAPVDGKDGLPHQGPFVETSAERDRKKTKVNDGEEPTTSPLKGSNVHHSVEPGTPLSNDGVMDDPNRLGPKEGTRGTEGGVSEKSKDNKMADKVPDPPKKEPPLPHSEAEKIGAEKGPKFLAEEEKKLLEVKACTHHATWRMLTIRFRNPQICPRNPTISLLQKTPWRTKIPRSSPTTAFQVTEIPNPLFQSPRKSQAQLSSPCTPSSSPSP